MDDKILLVAFYNGVTSDLFIHKLYDQEPQMMVKLIHSAQSSLNVVDVSIPKKKKKAEWVEIGYTHHPKQGPRPKKAKIGDKRDCDGRKESLSLGSYSSYTTLNTSLNQVLMEIKDDLSLKWPNKMKVDLRKRNKVNIAIFTETMDTIQMNVMI